jgi:hypothetical protein
MLPLFLKIYIYIHCFYILLVEYPLVGLIASADASIFQFLNVDKIRHVRFASKYSLSETNRFSRNLREKLLRSSTYFSVQPMNLDGSGKMKN